MFILQSEYDSAGDQQQAIDVLVSKSKKARKDVSCSESPGQVKRSPWLNNREDELPTLILSHNKTLARQIWQEMSGLFPDNSVEYFVSYYDYYQPEAYIPGRDSTLTRSLQMNERIEQERFSTVASLVSRPDVITIGTVSTIYGLNPPEVFQQNHLRLHVGQNADPQDVVRSLVELQYRRTTREITRRRPTQRRGS